MLSLLLLSKNIERDRYFTILESASSLLVGADGFYLAGAKLQTACCPIPEAFLKSVVLLKKDS